MSTPLPNHVQKNFIPYFETLKTVLGDNLISVFVYGSSTGLNYFPGISDINSVFVVKEINLELWSGALKAIRQGLAKKIDPPLIFTKAEILASLDTFPIEFMEMHENYTLVFGEDILSQVKINGEHIRIFCEQQLKGKLFRLRQAYCAQALTPQILSRIFLEALNSLIPVFRNLLRLQKVNPPKDKKEVILEVSQVFGLDANVFLSLYHHRSGVEIIAKQNVLEHAQRFLVELTKLTEKIDQL